MNFNAPIDSYERGLFLDATQDALYSYLDNDEIAGVLGEEATSKIKRLNDLLVEPLIESDGSAYVPDVHRMRDTVPFVALRRGETLTFNGEELLPSPRQIRSIRRALEVWSGDKDEAAILLAQNELLARATASMPAQVKVSLSPAKGIGETVYSGKMPSQGGQAALQGVPRALDVSTRPVVGMKFSPGDIPTARLLHGLIHVDQRVRQPLSSVNRDAKTKQIYRDELEAYHYSARFAEAVFSLENPGRLQKLWNAADLAVHTQVENVRKKFADSERPFEPTPKLVSELDKAGISWRA